MQLNPIRSVVIMLTFIIATTPIIAVATSGEDEKEYSSSYRLHSVLENVNNEENENDSYNEFTQLKQGIEADVSSANYAQRQEEIIERIEKEKEEEREKELEERRKAEEAEAVRLAEIEEEKRQQDAEEQAQAEREAEEQRLKEVEEQERIAQEEAEKEKESQEEIIQEASEQNEDFIEESESVKEEIVEEVKQVEKETSNTETYVVTAYTAGAESTDKNPGDDGYGVTASGEMVQEGHTIACPPHLDFGTEVHIPSTGGTYTCKDRGADIQGSRLDIYMSDLGQAQNFGRQEMEVEIK
ncbi:hypothetical protein GCM10008931_44070 [Oceanobacillus oncorhynchi subsp. oncorhynchi]|uniref:3D domain-containing protein n=1 Tax=Oceanobacillus oncorhynchi TaxID=545501 RepID=UPI0031DBB9E4